MDEGSWRRLAAAMRAEANAARASRDAQFGSGSYSCCGSRCRAPPFVMGLVVHAYRLTSPMGSPRSFAEAGYTGLAFATQGTGIGIPSAHDPSPKGDGADAHHAHLVE